jgi:2-polyprenyl-3-methyl-5-hydroxy-6-metoxy-1,4-benzoquinol methylase
MKTANDKRQGTGHDEVQDKAGQDYWNQAWGDYSCFKVWDVDSGRLRSHVEREFFQWIVRALENRGEIGPSVRLIEVGCARSQVLPVLSKRLGLSVAGMDYSPNGCEQARAILKQEEVEGEVYCADVFAIPEDMKEGFDVVISFGLVEHFSDTDEIVAALAKLLKPGGLMLTNIPNMRGSVGILQKIMNRGVFDIHMPLTPLQIRRAHEAAGLQVVEADYFLASNYGVINLGVSSTGSVGWWVKKLSLAMLSRASMLVWLLERAAGKLPAIRAFSPYVNCIAVKLSV